MRLSCSRVTPSAGKGALGTRWLRGTQHATRLRAGLLRVRSRSEAACKLGEQGANVSQRLSFGRRGRYVAGKWRAEPRSEPDSGNPTVRDRRGACGNAGMVRAKRARTAETPKQPSSGPAAARAANLSRHLHAACEVAGAGDGATDIPTRARRGKPRTQPRDALRATAPVLDPTRALDTQLLQHGQDIVASNVRDDFDLPGVTQQDEATLTRAGLLVS